MSNSKVVTEKSYELMKDFIKASLNFYEEGTEIAFVSYGETEPKVELNFTKILFLKKIKYVIDAIKLSSNHGSLETGLKYLVDNNFVKKKDGIQQVLLIFPPANEIVTENSEAIITHIKVTGTKIIVVGLGSVRESVLELSSDGDKFTHAPFDSDLLNNLGDLETIIAQITGKIV